MALSGLVGDTELTQLVAPFAQSDVKEAARALSARLVSRLVEGPLSSMPERPTREARSHAPVRRAVAKVGRNDPCPCGSGKKYKQCHEPIDRARLADSSDVVGLTSAELAEQLEEHLDEARLQTLRSRRARPPRPGTGRAGPPRSARRPPRGMGGARSRRGAARRAVARRPRGDGRAGRRRRRPRRAARSGAPARHAPRRHRPPLVRGASRAGRKPGRTPRVPRGARPA